MKSPLFFGSVLLFFVVCFTLFFTLCLFVCTCTSSHTYIHMSTNWCVYFFFLAFLPFFKVHLFHYYVYAQWTYQQECYLKKILCTFIKIKLLLSLLMGTTVMKYSFYFSRVFGFHHSSNLSFFRLSMYFFVFRLEIDELQQRVLKERDQYQAATQSAFPGISAVPFFSVNDKVIEWVWRLGNYGPVVEWHWMCTCIAMLIFLIEFHD